MVNRSFLGGFVALFFLLSTVGCRTTYYKMWETVGVAKRDLLKKKVVQARDSQEQATEQFKDALTRLKELYGFEGGNLEKIANQVKSEYEDASQKVNTVKTRIKEMNTVSKDLFVEWEKEIAEISSADLRNRSRSQLTETQNRYREVENALQRSEQSMEPVLIKLKDQVLFLKHNLNAQAISSLKSQGVVIQNDIQDLITQMNRSIEEADRFIKTLP